MLQFYRYLIKMYFLAAVRSVMSGAGKLVHSLSEWINSWYFYLDDAVWDATNDADMALVAHTETGEDREFLFSREVKIRDFFRLLPKA